MTEKEGMNMEKTMKMFEVRGKFRQKGEIYKERFCPH